MRNVISTALLCVSSIAAAQISVAGKANILVPTSFSSWKDLKKTALETYQDKGKSSIGFNVGVSAKIDLPTSYYLMPELYFTHYSNEAKDKLSQTSLKATTNRLDLPVLVGYKVWGDLASVFAGPVASYQFPQNETFGNFKEQATKNFTVGYQFGAQVEVSKLVLNARYEGAFTKDQRKFVSSIAGQNNYEVKYDNRPNFLILGVGYKF